MTLSADPPLLRTKIPGPQSVAIADRIRKTECPAFDARREAREAASGAEQTPIVYARGQGANLFDVDENRYVDFVQGFGAEVFGHAPPFLTEARTRAIANLPLALGDVYGSATKAELLERLTALLPGGGRAMLGLSGADAVTAGLKTAALAVGGRVLAFHGGYHGLSHGPLAACGLSARFRTPFADQLGAHVNFAEYPVDEPSLVRVFREVDVFFEGGLGTVIVEPILGRGGCIVPPPAFLPGLAERCRARGGVLFVDEVWTGMGRSGARILSLTDGVKPDIVALGKGLGGGAPVAACVGSEAVMSHWGAHGGTAIHTGTHFGNPDGCAAALAVLARLTDGLLGEVRRKGSRWRASLEKIRGVRSVRGAGLMVGVELGSAEVALRTARRLLEAGYIVLTGGAQWNVLTLTPPLEIPEEALSHFDDALAAALHGEP